MFVHSNIHLISQASLDYKIGPHRMWDYGGSMDDGNDELPIEVLEHDAEGLLVGGGHRGSFVEAHNSDCTTTPSISNLQQGF